MTTPRKSGLYALIRTDSGPLAARDCAALGLTEDRASTGWRAAAVDPCSAASDHRLLADGGAEYLAGDLWDLAEAAQALGVPADSTPAQIISAGFDRHGTETVWRLRGEWAWLRCSADGSVIVLTSRARRDPVLYAAAGPHVALAPDLAALARLTWVDSALDEDGLRFALGKAELRRLRGTQTMLRGVHEVPPGAMLTCKPGQSPHIARAAVPPPGPFAGDFGDAVEAARAHLLDDLRQRITRYPATAILLSGGLDSSLLAWLIAACGADPAQVRCFTSAAPPASGLADESPWAEAVAHHLGLDLHRIVPDPALDAYRPHDRILAGANGPPLANRHVLTEAFQQAALDHGCVRMINGTYGELGLTAHLPDPSRPAWLGPVDAVMAQLARLRTPPTASPFHARLAPHRQLVQTIPASKPLPPAASQFGFLRGADKAWSLANEFYAGAVRMDYPFRDPGLLLLLAGMPRRLPAGQNGDRALARAMLQGHLPDPLRLRRGGMPASPDHLLRIQQQAGGARQRVPEFRAAGLSDWFDLDWLDRALTALAQHGTRAHAVANEVQLTAIAAEFMLWWQERRM